MNVIMTTFIVSPYILSNSTEPFIYSFSQCPLQLQLINHNHVVCTNHLIHNMIVALDKSNGKISQSKSQLDKAKKSIVNS